MLTESGQALYGYARGIFALERSAVDDVQARLGLTKGKLVVGASTTVAGYWLPPYIAQFVKQFPKIGLQILAGNTQRISQALVDCHVDLAIVGGPVDDRRIRSTQWRTEALLVLAPSETSLALRRSQNFKTLSAYSWLVREEGSGTRKVTQSLLRQHGIKPRNTIEIGSNEAIARAVADGAGIAILPAIAVQELITLGRVKALRITQGSSLVRPLYLLDLKDRPLSPTASAFLAMLNNPAIRRKSSTLP